MHDIDQYTKRSQKIIQSLLADLKKKTDKVNKYKRKKGKLREAPERRRDKTCHTA